MLVSAQLKPSKRNLKEFFHRVRKGEYMDKSLFIVENIAKYKNNLEGDEDVICAGMSKSEKKAYQLGVQNMYAILKNVIEDNSNKGNYNIFVPENIQGKKFDLANFVKWDAERNKDKIIDINDNKDKAYIVTSEDDLDYYINAVFLNEEKAKAYCDCHKNCEIEEYDLSDGNTYTTFNTVWIQYDVYLDKRQSKDPDFDFAKVAKEDTLYKDENGVYVIVYDDFTTISLRRKLPDIYDEEEIRHKYTKEFYDLRAEIKHMLLQQDTSAYEKQQEAAKNILEAIKDKFGIEKE